MQVGTLDLAPASIDGLPFYFTSRKNTKAIAAVLHLQVSNEAILLQLEGVAYECGVFELDAGECGTWKDLCQRLNGTEASSSELPIERAFMPKSMLGVFERIATYCSAESVEYRWGGTYPKSTLVITVVGHGVIRNPSAWLRALGKIIFISPD